MPCLAGNIIEINLNNVQTRHVHGLEPVPYCITLGVLQNGNESLF